MKIYVAGNCQAGPLAACLELMNPGVRIERLRSWADPEAMSDGDILFRQRNARTAWNALNRRHNEYLFPRIAFNAFHPDIVRVDHAEAYAQAPMGPLQSSLVLYAWRRGMSAAEAAGLFIDPVFERAGFFDCWEPARHVLLEEGRSIDFPLEALFGGWERGGAFMRTPNHPVLRVMADVARVLMERAGLAPAVDRPEDHLDDPLRDYGGWPVYPELGRRLGVPGSYAFRLPRQPGRSMPVLIELDEFIQRSFAVYANLPPDALACKRLDTARYRDLERIVSGARSPAQHATGADSPPFEPRVREISPYTDLPSFHFWRRAIERIPAREVDPVAAPPFSIDRRARIATAGSCFAQHMSGVLERAGYNYFVAETSPAGLSADEGRCASYGIFSTRCGNIYTARQLLQLFDRAYGSFVPYDRSWLRPDGRHADPFRAQVEPDGFATLDALLESRERHFSAVRTMFEQLDVFIFTLGLTEAWRSKADGAVFSSAPGVVAGTMNHSLYEFINFTAADVRDDLAGFLARLHRVNPAAKVVLTVSPQPPIATFEPRHVLVSATYTKAALRVAADEIERAHPGVWYFPAFELITGSFNRGAYFERDLRTVTSDGVNRVMRLFLSHCGSDERQYENSAELDEHRAGLSVMCDEEAIAYEASPALSARVAGAAPAEWEDHALFHDRDALLRLLSLRRGAEAETEAAAMDALAPSSMRVRLEASLPGALAARSVVSVPCVVANLGDVSLVTGGARPVFACYRWYDDTGAVTEVGESLHTPLPAAIEPGASMPLSLYVAAPRYAGRYGLRVTLLQPEVAWFDDVDSGNGLEAVVDVSENVVAAAI
jgi:GSCFA family protein/polysaccharide biosynthesis acetyltransferase WcbI-like protein